MTTPFLMIGYASDKIFRSHGLYNE